LKTLDEQNKIDFLSVVGDHLQVFELFATCRVDDVVQFTDEWFKENIIAKYLNTTVPVLNKIGFTD
jgi:hypothetical protein